MPRAAILQALGAELTWRAKQGADAATIETLERSMIGLVGSHCQFVLLTGHTEKAVGLVQALLEFHFFCPTMAGGIAW